MWQARFGRRALSDGNCAGQGGTCRRAGRVTTLAALTTLAVWLMAPSMSLGASPPPNDNYLASTVIPQAETTGLNAQMFVDAQNTSAATTQLDLFNPDKFGAPFGGAGREPSRCQGFSYGNTIWYDMHPQVPGGVELVAAGFPTAIAVYRWSPQTNLITRRVQCQVANSVSNDLLLTQPGPYGELQKGKAYTVQIGGLQSASGFASGQLDFKMTFVPDHDGDGQYDPIDKCPYLPGVERFGGCPPQIEALPRFTVTPQGSGVQFSLLRLDQIPGGAQVLARCRACGLRQVRQAGTHASSVTMTAFAGQTLAVGDKLEIWVTKRPARNGNFRYGAFGSYISYTVSSAGLGNRIFRCLMPGSLTPRQVCPPRGRRKVTSHVGRAESGVSAAAWRRFASESAAPIP